MKPLKERISITIDDDVLREAREVSLKNERSLSQFINIAVREYLQSEKQKGDQDKKSVI